MPDDRVPPRPAPTPASPAPITPTPATPTPNVPARREPFAPPQPAELVSAAGTAILTTAKLGRILGRTGWRLARQLPGAGLVEQSAQRLRQRAESELRRLVPASGDPAGTATTPEEQRVMMLVQSAGTDPQPLRSAMTELLAQANNGKGPGGRDYLFGTIVSQLVPDEARLLAMLARGSQPALDVVAKRRRGRAEIVLANVSALGETAGASVPRDVSTYLGRLRNLGLIGFGPPEGTDEEYAALENDPSVQAAQRGGRTQVIRKSIMLTSLGLEFWAACAPSRNGVRPRRT